MERFLRGGQSPFWHIRNLDAAYACGEAHRQAILWDVRLKKLKIRQGQHSAHQRLQLLNPVGSGEQEENI
jgi:hypothetical protein